MAQRRSALFHAEMLNGLDQAHNKQLEVHFYEEKELNDHGS